MTYQEQRQYQADLEASLRAMADLLQTFPRGSMGITPDDVKRSPAYRAAKTGYDVSFARLRNFNARFTKEYAAELRAERRANRNT